MKIVIVAYGSQGDVQPFIALATGLKDAGFEVVFATGFEFQDTLNELGFEFRPFGKDLKKALSTPEGQRLIRSRNPITLCLNLIKTASDIIKSMLDDLFPAVDGADAVITNYLGGLVLSIHEKNKLPCMIGLPYPLLKTRSFPHCVVAPFSLGPKLNRFSYDIVQVVFHFTFGLILNRWRKKHLGLPRQRIFEAIEASKIPVLNAYSEQLLPRPSDWPSQVVVTGLWTIDNSKTYIPPSDLDTFLKAGAPPVCAGFGSMTAKNSDKMDVVIREALHNLGVRAILVGGWGKILSPAGEKNDNIFRIDQAPYDWLLPKVSVMVHHGGAGTTGITLRAGIPSVIIPFFGEQPFWAHQVYRLGASPRPLNRRSLNADRLTKALDKALNDTVIRKNAARIGAAIRAENGVSNAVRFITDYLKTAKV